MVSIRDSHLLTDDEFSVERWQAQLEIEPGKPQTRFGKAWALCEQVVPARLAIAEERLAQASQGLSDEQIGKLQSEHQGQREALETQFLALRRRALEMTGILGQLSMDAETLIAAMLFPFVESGLLEQESVRTTLGSVSNKLLQGVSDMEAIRTLQSLHDNEPTQSQVDNLRRMLLAMVDDVRAVVIKLAERICRLREVKNDSEEERVLTGREIADIYAPLANRLGIGQLKWELEDLSFRYLHPKTYKQIAKLLDERRIDRETYIEDFVTELNHLLKTEGIKAEVYGRPKHIYSIWKKMQKKSLDFTELYDVRAVRIIADSLKDCYGALGVVHTRWPHLPNEFDDYIATPKPNGYKSIHTVVIGPAKKSIEIQIRTEQMHEEAELGVAAHWKYKEGPLAGRTDSYEDKIAWLRKILQWQEDVADSGNLVEELRNQVFEDRVYVFTPKGEVMDLPMGSTPLDFAYYIHSEVGHKCTGAKVDGRIVPFTYQLTNGERLEIITSKTATPSRDWLNPGMGYIRSSRARAKINAWFKLQDRDVNLAAGKEMLESELAKLGMKLDDATPAIERFNMSTLDDLLAAIGAGDARINQVTNYLQQLQQKALDAERSLEEEEAEAASELVTRTEGRPRKSDGHGESGVVVEGVGNLLTHMARCCQPVPGDQIMGYITQGRGISVHRLSCEQLEHLIEEHPERQVELRWGEKVHTGYAVAVRVTGLRRGGLLRDISTLLANERVQVLSVNSRGSKMEDTHMMDLELEIPNLDAVSKIIGRLTQLDGIIEARRL